MYGEEEIISLEKNQAWIATQNLVEYAGEWIAVFNRNIIARGRELKVVLENVGRSGIPLEQSLYVRVPEGIITT